MIDKIKIGWEAFYRSNLTEPKYLIVTPQLKKELVENAIYDDYLGMKVIQRMDLPPNEWIITNDKIIK